MAEENPAVPRKELIHRELLGIIERGFLVSELISALVSISLARAMNRTSYNLSNALSVAIHEEGKLGISKNNEENDDSTN